MWINLVLSISIAVLRQVAKPIIKTVFKNKLVKEFGEDFVSKLLKQYDDGTDLGRYIKQLKKAGISKELIEQFADKYGKEGLDWLLSKKHLGLSDDLLKKVLKAGNLDDFTDEVNGGNGYGIKTDKNPDFLINGRVFDCYSPQSSTKPDGVIDNIAKKPESRRIELSLIWRTNRQTVQRF